MPYKDPEVQRAYQNAWLKKRRQEWIDENGPCACGSEVDLEVHHKDPVEKVTHRVWSWSADKRAKELVKCVVECNKCHRGKHNEEMRKPIPHGTNSGYTGPNYGCRCRACTAAHAKYERQRRRKNKLLAL